MRLDASIERLLTEVVAAEGLELLATEVVGSGSKMILRMVIDGPEGVTLDTCAIVSRQASAILDVEDPIQHSYSLEVSSPGLDRKFYSREDYRRFAGHQVTIRMRPSYRSHRVVTGELIGVEDDQLRIRLPSHEVVALPYDEVFETRLEVDWNAIMREGKARP
jgi:ribosome maturation factor RimP